jgi:hypothetical protein
VTASRRLQINPEDVMKRLLMVALVCIATPTALAAPPTAEEKAASKTCKTQRKAMGMEAFRLLHAATGTPKAALDACVAQQAQVVSTTAKNAAKACKQERGTTSATRSAFETKYGTNDNMTNAFGKCVSSKSAEELAEQQQATLNAAKACKAELGTTAATRSAFATKYGTNANKRNAFGKCVSRAVKTG